MAVQFPVGSRRLPKGAGSGASATRDVRAQMADVQKAFEAVINNVEEATVEAIREGLQPVYDKSQALVPVLTGALKESGFIEVEKRASGAHGVVGYARGSHPPYAAIVHERLDLHHEAPTQAKFLEAAVMEELPKFEARLVAAMSRALGINS